jgi:hypothetical protein
MNKFFTTLLVVLGISTTAFSQTKGTNEVSINVGYNASTVTASNLSADYKSGFNAGIALDHYFSESWSIKVKAAYDQKGWANGFYGNSAADYKLDYVTIPVMANWHFGRTKNWYLNFGPYVGFLLNASETSHGTDVKPFFSTTDAGLDVGIGVKFPVSDKAKFFIELNGQGGIADINKGNSGTTIRNSVSNINIGFAF